MKNQKRVVVKKGKYVTTKKGPIVLRLANSIYEQLKPFSRRVKIAGSIRRKEKKPVDIDIVLIPKNKEKILELMRREGKYLQGGEKLVSFRVKGVKVEIYYATPESWGAMLLAYTGPKGASIGLRTLARKKGYLLNQYGIFSRRGEYLAGRTEKDVYDVLGKKLKSPSLR